MSVPGNINPAPPPSSFDGDAEFYEESRLAKLQRRVFEEPLIPLGCALTCWALFEATRSIRRGDKYATNQMFRRRIYAQGFTIMAMLVGSVYWEGDRKKRNQYNELVSDQQKRERHELWLKELEAREEEDQEERRMRERIIQGRIAERKGYLEGERRATEARLKKEAGQQDGGFGEVRSVLETGEGRAEGKIVAAVRRLLRER